MKTLPFKIGAHPINWVGEDVKEHGAYTTYEQIMDEMQRLGLTGTEMGRKYPTDIEVLKQELAKRNLQLVSQWKSVLFSDPAYREEELAAYEQHVKFLKEMGSTVISTCEVGGSLHFDPRRTPHEKEVIPLDEAGWKSLAEGLNAAGAIAKQHGLKLTYHHHGGTAVESPEEIDRLMELTDPDLVYLLFDTGHAYYGGANPIEVLRKHYNRIAYIHLKDVRQPVLDEARSEKADFITCIRKGVFTVPGTGDLDFRPVVEELLARGYNGWAMLEGEQDPAKAPAFEFASKAITYLESLLPTKAGESQ
ncbi:myo-inosose-2 dehydratase [Paenibacillus glycanilyticus]|uniref:Myo-inosose-2 dehydratase n=1 Tax=Paenibacillus glycanilyticus TaxID=126569 RepID=A0ABQ6NHY8_9BACL|nr:myo-inosose-2 dehydratase [Paenibacillus glycanilyticus]GMK44153.1 myo-inosose-2 dehydratase [Paenibacillus glycanilyticus]